MNLHDYCLFYALTVLTCMFFPPPLAASSHSPSSCYPSPCGQNSHCQEMGGRSHCSCLPNYLGSPPRCRPECITNSECSAQEACANLKCINPCVGACGVDSDCRVIHHNPVCSCRPKYMGNPLAICLPLSLCKHYILYFCFTYSCSEMI